jgi:hypothetical protein
MPPKKNPYSDQRRKQHPIKVVQTPTPTKINPGGKK